MSGFLASLRGLVTPATINVAFEGEATRRKIRRPSGEKEGEPLLLYGGKDPVKGTITITPLPGKKVDHTGISCEFVGIIELFGEKTISNNFVAVTKELEPAGTILQTKTYSFDFSNIKKEYETYYGINANLRYLIIVKVHRSLAINIVEEREIFVRVLQSEPDSNKTIKMAVGVPGSLHIEFEYSRSRYHLNDCIIGKISFSDCRLKVKNMEVAILKKETTFQDASAYNESDNLMRFEVMDGAPVKGEIIPIRMYLKNLDLTPTYPTVNSCFQVRYYLNIVIFDEEDRRYFKQAEITLWRKDLV